METPAIADHPYVVSNRPTKPTPPAKNPRQGLATPEMWRLLLLLTTNPQPLVGSSNPTQSRSELLVVSSNPTHSRPELSDANQSLSNSDQVAPLATPPSIQTTQKQRSQRKRRMKGALLIHHMTLHISEMLMTFHTGRKWPTPER